MITLKIRMYTNLEETKREYDSALAEYEQKREKHYNIYNNYNSFDEQTPIFEEKFKFVEGVFTHPSLILMGLTHYLIHAEDSETLSLIFIDNTRITAQDTPDVREFLNKVLQDDKLSK